MKGLLKYIVLIAFAFTVFSSVLVQSTYAQANPEDNDTIYINEWEMKWETNPDATIEDAMSEEQAEGWFPVSYGEDLPEKPEEVNIAWLRFQLPEYDYMRPALLINKLTAEDVYIFLNRELVFESLRTYSYNKNEILLPLNPSEQRKDVYLKLNTNADWLGLKERLLLGEYHQLNKGFTKQGILDVILGSSLIFISLVMLISMFFISRSYLVGWNSLSMVLLSVGLMILTYSPFLHNVTGKFGDVFYYSFDIASTLFMPALFIYFENVFGKGPYNLITILRKLQILLAIINYTFFVLGFFSEGIKVWYTIFGSMLFGAFIIVSNVVLIVLLIIFCKQGNKEAYIFTIGFSLFAAIGALELVWFFLKGMEYNLFVWKWGILCFFASLIIILVKRIIRNYEQVVEYSKQLEIFNNELQRSEKMEIISQLAASVAHEVRNPLQVTRGFLQLLGNKTEDAKSKSYMWLAIDELDRASEIITDFLTFAKPQVDQSSVLNIANELSQIEGILIPLATMRGGIIKVDLTPELYIRGNSSKLKQALINIIKNSIEALGDEGQIDVIAYKHQDSNEIVIRIKDNGEGMYEEDLIRLGEPYYSKKTKGTGLGLMVTFRIIEIMQGRLQFFSTKGKGTEAVIHLPAVEKNTPDAL